MLETFAFGGLAANLGFFASAAKDHAAEVLAQLFHLLGIARGPESLRELKELALPARRVYAIFNGFDRYAADAMQVGLYAHKRCNQPGYCLQHSTNLIVN